MSVSWRLQTSGKTVDRMTAPARLILVHKQRTSARIRFLRFADGIAAPEPFPKLAQVLDKGEQGEGAAVVAHPAMLVGQVAKRLGLAAGDIELESEFSAHVDTPAGVSRVYLGQFTSMDPPFEAAENAHANFIAITEARDLSPTELELLRRAYACIME